MKFEWESNAIDAEIGCYTCRLVDDKGNPINGPEIHLTDYTCPWRETDLKRRLESEPHTSRLLAQAKVAYEWTYCYGISVTECYMRDEGLTLDDAKHLIEQYLIDLFRKEFELAQKAINQLAPVIHWSDALLRTAPFRFENGREMLDALQHNDLYNPDTNTYAFVYNESGSIAVYDWIDRDEALKLSAMAEGNNDYWGSGLGPGGDIYDDPCYPGFDPDNYTSNLEWCNEHCKEGRWYTTDGWQEINKQEPEKEETR